MKTRAERWRRRIAIYEQITPLLGAVAIILLSALMAVGIQGCGAVKVKAVDDPVVRSALLRETGFTLAYYALGRESDEAVARVETAVQSAVQMLETRDVREVAPLVIAYVRDFPQWKTGNDSYDRLIGSAINILSALVKWTSACPRNARRPRTE